LVKVYFKTTKSFEITFRTEKEPDFIFSQAYDKGSQAEKRRFFFKLAFAHLSGVETRRIKRWRKKKQKKKTAVRL
jgi:hypothetical protein